MKTSSFVNSRVAKKNADKGSSMGMDAENFEHIIAILTNLYSQPAVAVFREYVSNALDSHYAAGQKLPVKVTLPTAENPVLKVQDFGVGMSLDEINNIYRQYGSSTKQDDNGQIGGFGLGGKSALALTKRFDAVSVKDSVSVAFHIGQDEEDIPRLFIDHVEDTLEANGFTVLIPYKAQDFITEEFARNFFIGVPPEQIEINGTVSNVSVYNPDLFSTLNDVDGTPIAWYSLAEGVGFSSSPANAIKAVVGGVLYDITSMAGDKDSPNANMMRRLTRLTANVHLNVPIGSVKLTPSREELRYTDKTVATLTDLIDSTFTLLQSQLRSELNSIESRVEAIKFYTQWNFRASLDNFTWRGEKVPTLFSPTNTYFTLVGPVRNKGSQIFSARSKSTHDILKEWEDADYRIAVLSDGEDVHSDAIAIRRKLRVLGEAFGYTKVDIFSEEDYANPWLRATKAFNKRFTKASELLEAAKEYSRSQKGTVTQRKATGVTEFPYSIVTFDEDSTYTVRRVTSDHAELKKKKVVYMEENQDRGYYPGFRWYGTTKEQSFHSDPTGYWTIARKLYKNHLLVLITNRHSIEKFQQLYPSSTRVTVGVREHVKKTFVPIIDTSWKKISLYVPYTSRMNSDKLVAIYRELKKSNNVSDTKLDDLVNMYEFAAPVKPADYDVMARLAGYNEEINFARAAANEVATLADSLAVKYAVLLHAANAGVKEHAKLLSEVFKLSQAA